VAVASLAIGIGFNTALFAIADALLFKPLPVRAPEHLVDVFTNDSTGTQQFSTSSYPDYLDLKAGNDVFSGLVGYSPRAGGAVCAACRDETTLVLAAEGLNGIEALLRRPLAEAGEAGLSTRATRDALAVVNSSHEFHGGFRLRTLAR